MLSDEECQYWKNIWLDALGWSHKYPHTTNLHKIISRGNYKWHPFTDGELEIELERYKNNGKDKIRVSNIKTKI